MDDSTGRSLSATDRDRLSKLCGLFSSHHDGERAAAAAKADQLIRSRGLTWPDVLAPPLPAPAPAPPPSPFARRWYEPMTPQQAARQCLRWPEYLTPWEAQFCGSLVDRWRITPKQRRVMDRIVLKVRAAAGAGEYGRW